MYGSPRVCKMGVIDVAREWVARMYPTCTEEVIVLWP